MATKNPNFERLLKSLSQKLRDPITAVTADGKIFSYEQKAGYLREAYIRVKRKIKQIAPTLYNIYFPSETKYFVIYVDYVNDAIKFTLNESIEAILDIKKESTATNPPLLAQVTVNLGEIFGTDDPQIISQIHEIYVYVTLDSKAWEYKTAAYLDPENFFKSIFDAASEFYSKKKGNIYFTVMNNKVIFSSDTYKVSKIKFHTPNFVPLFKADGNYDLIINSEIEDLFKAEAALEAMLDKGDNQGLTKAKFYSSFISNELSLVKYREESQMQKDKATALK